MTVKMQIDNFSIRQGDTATRVLTVLDTDDVAVNITGATLTCHIRAKGSTTDAIAAPTLALTTPASGITTLTISAALSATLSAATTYLYEVEMVDSDAAVSTPFQGLLYVQEDRG